GEVAPTPRLSVEFSSNHEPDHVKRFDARLRSAHVISLRSFFLSGEGSGDAVGCMLGKMSSKTSSNSMAVMRRTVQQLRVEASIERIK
ncbi:guanine nucleotide-binding protein G(I)/G(S)/G(O) subunit gamma-12, partial [Clarias magur]